MHPVDRPKATCVGGCGRSQPQYTSQTGRRNNINFIHPENESNLQCVWVCVGVYGLVNVGEIKQLEHNKLYY